jgi:hypothetical protein
MMENKKKSLYAMWLEAHKKNDLPPEWTLAHEFLTWATANGYKPKYGYKGKFTPENLLAAITSTTGTTEPKGDDMSEVVSELVNNNTLAELKEMAKDIGLGKATSKKDIAKLIVENASAGSAAAFDAYLLAIAGAKAGYTIGEANPEVDNDAGE